MKVLTHNTHYTMPIVPVRPISLCSIGVSPVEFVNSWYFGVMPIYVCILRDFSFSGIKRKKRYAGV